MSTQSFSTYPEVYFGELKRNYTHTHTHTYTLHKIEHVMSRETYITRVVTTQRGKLAFTLVL